MKCLILEIDLRDSQKEVLKSFLGSLPEKKTD